MKSEIDGDVLRSLYKAIILIIMIMKSFPPDFCIPILFLCLLQLVVQP